MQTTYTTMTEQSLFTLITLLSVSFCSSDFSFQNATIEWNLQNNQHITPGKPTNKLNEHFPKGETSDRLTTVVIKGSVKTLYQGSVKNISYLADLDMTGVSLQKIEPGAFENLPVLHNLYLGKNDIQKIRNGTFINLPSCHHINISYNQISTLEVGAFKNLPELIFLHLSENKIDKIGRGVFDHITLRILDLSDNFISELEDGVFAKVSPIRKLNIYLVLSNNKLTEVSPRALNHSYVTHVHLTNNLISSLRPRDLQNLPRLKYLLLNRNKLKTIQEGVFNNINIISVDFSHNDISSIARDAFDNMPKLRIIRLDYNKIKSWNNNWFRDSEAIMKITACHNLIEELPEEAFKNYQNLFSIDLTSNRIKTINSLAFYNTARGITNLGYLILRDNLIKKWEQFLLVNRAHITLYAIDLRKNKLNCFENGVYDNFERVEVVWLSDNPFDETCVEEIKKYSEKHKNYKTPEKLDEEVLY